MKGKSKRDTRAHEGTLPPFEFAQWVNSSRRKVPARNRSKFDAEARDVTRLYLRVFNLGNIEWMQALVIRWKNRLDVLLYPGAWCTPPMLIRKRGESTREWLNRCYQEWR